MMILLEYTYEQKTQKGIVFTSVDCEVECELRPAHCPTHDFAGGFCVGDCPDRRPAGVSVSAVYIGKENLFDGDTFHRQLAGLIAGEAENSPWVLKYLQEDAAEEWRARRHRA